MAAVSAPLQQALADPGRHARLKAHAGALERAYRSLDALALLRVMIRQEFPGRLALVSAFGTESAVLLDLVAQVDPATPVIFLDTQKLFDESVAYEKELETLLGLKDVRHIRPDPADLGARDADGALWRRNPDLCCHLRKVVPLERALEGFDAWITGRKRYHGNERAGLERIESDGRRIKINPLADWSRERISSAFEERGLPDHPLISKGYLSVGCVPCTRPVEGDAPVRAGRWWGSAKTECGIHRPAGPPEQARG